VVAINQGNVFFNVLKSSDADRAKQLADIAIDVYAATVAPASPLGDVIIDETGHYSTGAMLEAAKKNDPLIILAPTTVPGEKLTADVLHSLRKMSDPNASAKTVVEFAKRQPQALIFPLFAPPIPDKAKPPAVEKVEQEAKKIYDKSRKEFRKKTGIPLP
jgi:hypothetical protein